MTNSACHKQQLTTVTIIIMLCFEKLVNYNWVFWQHHTARWYLYIFYIKGVTDDKHLSRQKSLKSPRGYSVWPWPWHRGSKVLGLRPDREAYLLGLGDVRQVTGLRFWNLSLLTSERFSKSIKNKRSSVESPDGCVCPSLRASPANKNEIYPLLTIEWVPVISPQTTFLEPMVTLYVSFSVQQ